MLTCWICGNRATTAEHKIKKSDLVRVHGRGKAFTAESLNYLRSDGTVVILQGPDSKWLKWPDVLCAPCNNHKTQPFDRAYEKFIEYVEANRQELLTRRQVDFEAIYGIYWRSAQRDLLKYFVKAFGCKIAGAERPVPRDIVSLMIEEQFETSLWVCIAVNEDELLKSESNQNKLQNGNLIANRASSMHTRYAFAYFYRWLVFSFWHGWGPFGPVGGRWCADSQFINLGSYRVAEATPNVGTESDPMPWPAF